VLCLLYQPVFGFNFTGQGHIVSVKKSVSNTTHTLTLLIYLPCLPDLFVLSCPLVAVVAVEPWLGDVGNSGSACT
jgi:hypothetical protein